MTTSVSTTSTGSARSASVRCSVISARPSASSDASREELEAVPGIPGKLARDIHRQLNKTG